MRSISHWCLAALCAGLAATSIAAESALPAVQQQGGISYVTGGVGLDEASALRAAAPQYNLRLTFATASGEYAAGVKVVLRDAKGQSLVEAASDGPFMYLQVPPGKYQVSAEGMGETLTRPAVVRPKGGTELIFRWKTPAE